MAGLAYAQQQQVIAHTGFSQQAVRILSIIGKLLYSVLGIVVIPGHAIVVDESEQLVLIFNQPRSKGLGGFRANGLLREGAKEIFHGAFVFLKAFPFQSIFVNGCDDRAQQATEWARNQLKLFVKRIIQQFLIDVPHEMNEALLLGGLNRIVGGIEVRDQYPVKVLQ